MAGKRSPKKRPPRKRRKKPVADEGRAVPWGSKLLLAVRAGGRCEFPGCNKALFEHHLTLTVGNFGQYAHIRAFSAGGPRGSRGRRPADVHDIDNLLLLCPPCHKLIDDHPDAYPTGDLKTAKAEHEARIERITGLGPESATVVLQLKARINGDAVDIPLSDVVKAVAPRYPADRRGHVIDITPFHDESDATFQAACAEIRRAIGLLYAPGMEADRVRHVSVFALAPIPLLVYFGARLTNKIPHDLFQRHRDTQDWIWKNEPSTVEYEVQVLRRGTDEAKVALALPLSGELSKDTLPPAIDDTFTVYALGLRGRLASPDFLRTRQDLLNFERTYRDLMATIEKGHRGVDVIHLFPAVPAPVAVACGHNLLQKVHPPLLVYDFNATKGGFIARLRTDDQDVQ